MFYLIQYSISNLNAFILILTIGYSLYCYVDNTKSTENIGKEEGNKEKTKEEEKTEENGNLSDVNNSPIQLIDQLKGYYYINPIIALSLGITLFSFAGIPPLIGFFGKQMILSAAVDNGFIFMALVAILTSVISAVYYLAIIKQIFFDKPDYLLNDELHDMNADGLITTVSLSKDLEIILPITTVSLVKDLDKNIYLGFFNVYCFYFSSVESVSL
jgi:NADH-ubiquinone oxidoreductase chain 2